jgi:hypothetical protein
VFVDAQLRGLSQSTSGSELRQASFNAAWTIHHETPNAVAVSETARPSESPRQRAGPGAGLWTGHGVGLV